MKCTRLLPVALFAGLLAGCGYIATRTAPAKTTSAHRSETASRSDILFWNIQREGRYEDIGKALEVLTEAYYADPHDAMTAAHIGWLHIWRLAERARLDQVPASITDDATLARQYFAQADRMMPAEARFRGLLANSMLAEADIHKDERALREGYFLMREAIRAWPEFNLFPGGYILSRQPYDSPRFREGLDWQWQRLDTCFGVKRDAAGGDATGRGNATELPPFTRSEVITGPKRVCWNSWITPHNVEGYFLNMGDMLVKSGDWQTARTVYAAARRASTYPQWKYRDVLEQRIVDAEANVTMFRRGDDNDADPRRHRLMIDSTFSCAGCHEE